MGILAGIHVYMHGYTRVYMSIHAWVYMHIYNVFIYTVHFSMSRISDATYGDATYYDIKIPTFNCQPLCQPPWQPVDLNLTRCIYIVSACALL